MIATYLRFHMLPLSFFFLQIIQGHDQVASKSKFHSLEF